MSNHPILVVDDEYCNLALFRQILEPCYPLVFARSGLDALAAVKKHHPCLILLDIQMPGMDGYQVCQALKADPATMDIPVIFVTALAELGNEEKGFAVGCVDYLSKPVAPSLVLARVKMHLALVSLAQQRLALSLASSHAGLWEWNLETQQLFWTDTLRALYGLPASMSASYDNWLATVYEDDQAALLAQMHQALDQCRPFILEWRVAGLATDEERWLMSNGQPVYDDTGKLLFYRGVVLDITQRKQQEQKLIEQTERLDFALSTLAVGAWELDLQSQKAERTLLHDQIFGYPALLPEWGFEQFMAHVLPEDRAAVSQCFETAIHTRSDWEFECRIRRQDGEIRWIYAKGRFKSNATGPSSMMAGIVQDITARKQAEQAFRNSEREFRLLAESMPQIVWVTRPDGWNIYFNHQWVDYTGLSLEESYGHGWNIPFHPEDQQKAWDAWQNAVHHRVTYSLECRLRRADGVYRWWLVRGVPALDEQGSIFKWFGTCTDIHDIKLAEESLKQSETRYRQLFASNPVPLWIYDLETFAFLDVNDAAIVSYGYSREEFLSMTIKDIRPAEDIEALEQNVATSALHEDQYNHAGIWRHVRKDGSLFWVVITGHALMLNGRPAEIILAQDITEQHEAELKLIESEARWQFALEGSNQGVWDWDISSGKVFYSKRWKSMLGFAEHEIADQVGEWSERVHPDDLHAALDAVQKHFRAEVPSYQHEHRIKNRAGEYRWILGRGIVVARDATGKPLRMIGTYEDITEHKQRDVELREYRYHLEQLVQQRTAELNDARQEAEQLAQAKGIFLANMSHEIRTPMNAVIGFCYLLEQRSLDTETRQLVKKIHSAGRSLLSIINDILDFSKIQAGRLALEQESFQLLDMVDDLASMMSAYIGKKTIELVLTPPLNVNVVTGDRQRIQQVLINLIGNAVKFTDNGEVELRIDVVEALAEAVCLRFRVKDTGIGISQDKQKDIFQAFTQADTSISRRFGGTGLGLAISRQLVELMGGTLEVTSQEGVGTEFSFVLQLPKKQPSERLSSTLKPLNLLVVDDNPAALHALANVANILQWQADTVGTAESAIEHLLRHWDDKQAYDAILIDWKMPEQDGLQMVQTLRQAFLTHAGEHLPTPVVIMAMAYDLDALSAQAAMDQVAAVISKPVTTVSLHNTLIKLVDQSMVNVLEQSVSQPQPEKNLSGLRILVVDDSDFNLEIAQYLLENQGARVSLATNGLEALNWLNTHAAEVDIILMDIQMPVMDGYECTRTIRNTVDWKQLPIIALSAGVLKEEQEQAIAAGMDDFESKPLNVERLMNTIKRLTDTHRGKDGV